MELLRSCKIRMMIICVVFSQCLMSCLYDEMYNFSDKDLKWMTPYEEGDSVVFRSVADYDTLIVLKKNIENSYFPFRRNEGFSTYHAHGTIKNTILHKGTPISLDYYVSKGRNGLLSLRYYFEDRCCSLFVCLHEDDYYGNGHKLNLYMDRIGSVLYKDLVIVRKSNSELRRNACSAYNCEYFYWSKSKGLLKYKYMDSDSVKGDVYTFYKRLPYKEPKKIVFWSFLYGE